MQLMTAVVLCGVIALDATHPDLSGRWTFNAAHSDNPRNTLQGGRGGFSGRGGG